jgi:hypothetical protein
VGGDLEASQTGEGLAPRERQGVSRARLELQVKGDECVLWTAVAGMDNGPVPDHAQVGGHSDLGRRWRGQAIELDRARITPAVAGWGLELHTRQARDERCRRGVDDSVAADYLPP